MHTISASRPIGAIPPNNPPLWLGMNLPPLVDFSQDRMFVNLLYTTRGFANTTDPFMNTLPMVPLDLSGWPTTDFALTLPKTLQSTGTENFNFGCTGDASTVSFASQVGWVWSSGPTYNSGTNRTTGILTAPSGAHGQPAIVFTNTRRTNASPVNTGVTNLEISRPGFPADGTAPRYFPPFITYLQSMCKGVRSMDWQLTNNNTSTTPFSSELSLSNYRVLRQANGNGTSAVEYPVQLATDLAVQAGLSVWVNVKAMADDQYMTDFATSLKNTVPSSTEIIVELGNEDWNSSFRQYFAIFDQVCIEVDGWHNFNSFNDRTRVITSVVRTAGVITVTVNNPLTAQYVPGATVYVLAIGTLSGAQIIQSVPTSTTFTLNNAGQPDTGNIVNGGSSVIRISNSDLNAWDGSFDIIGHLHPRWISRRVCQMSDIFRSVFGNSAMNTWVNIWLGTQTNNDGTDHIAYITNQLPHSPSYYLRAIGNAWYVNYNGAPYGGSDLRNLNTFNGNTPPSQADYLTTLNLGVDGAKISNILDKMTRTAKLNSLEVWQYETGYDMNSTNGAPTGATNNAKLTALFDPSMKATTERFLTDKLRFGYKRIFWFNAGAVDPTSTSENNAWPIVAVTNETDVLTSSRTQAFIELATLPHPGITRNMVTAVGATVIDARAIAGTFPTDWPTGNSGYTGAAITWVDPNNNNAARTPSYIISGEDGQMRTITINASASSNGRGFFVVWNGLQVGTVALTNGQTLDYTFTVYLQRGPNVFELPPNGFVGTFGQVNTFTFPAVA